MFKGSIPALITPFKGGEVDWPAFESLIEWQIEQGSHGVVPTGTTGESPTISHEEHMAIVERCVQVVNGRVPVIAGTGSNSTREAIALTQAAKDAGADAALIVSPYYNKPSQEGLYAHYRAIHDAVSIPIVLYNIPGRSIVDIDLDTMADLARLPNIVGVKDATSDLSRVCALKKKVGDDFAQLSGDDASTAGFYAQGGHGCISVVANIAPAMSASMYDAWVAGDLELFGKIRDALAPLARDLFCECSPAPVKYAAARLGLCEEDARLPVLPASKEARKIVDAAMKHAGLNQRKAA